MKKILIICDTSRAPGRKFLVGAETYISNQTEWEVNIRSLSYLQKNNSEFDFGYSMKGVDGLLAVDAFDMKRILEVDIPKVVMSVRLELIPGISTIMSDSFCIGQFAAKYFLNLGFSHFAFCGFKEFAWSQKRYEGFKKTVLDSGAESFSTFEDLYLTYHQGEAGWRKLSEWLVRLPHPVGVFACNDNRAISVLEACTIAGLSVPEDVAVLGADNDELICNLLFPSLSSIELSFEDAGYAAAEHLDMLMRGESDHRTIIVRPVEVFRRRSTDTMLVSDEGVVSALIFIRRNFDKPIQVDDVADAVFIHKRVLQKRFQKCLNRTIKDEIERLRIEFIKKKLLGSQRPLNQIAKEFSFVDPEHFSRYFKNIAGQGPMEFRTQNLYLNKTNSSKSGINVG